MRQRLTDHKSFTIIQEVADVVTLAATITFFVSFVIYLGSKEGLTSLLRDIAMLQSIIYFPALNILTPANAVYFFSLFQPLVSFELGVIEKSNEWFYSLTSTSPLNE